jgi:hypothetical protein
VQTTKQFCSIAQIIKEMIQDQIFSFACVRLFLPDYPDFQNSF